MITTDELLCALGQAGWIPDHQMESHIVLCHPQYPGRVTVPKHTGRTLKLKTLESILDQAVLSADELRALL